MNPFDPLPTGAASAVPLPKLFTPNQVLGAALVGGTGAVGLAAAYNFRAAGRPREAWACALIGVALASLLVFFDASLPPHAANAISIVVALAARVLVARLNPRLVAALGGAGQAPSRGVVSAVGLALGSLAAVMIVPLTFLGPDALFRQVTLKTGNIVEYRGGATPAQARATGEALLTMGAFGDNGVDMVRLERLDEGYGLGVFQRPRSTPADEARRWHLLAGRVGDHALEGRPMRLRTCSILLDRCEDWP
jgi:hypothetical protein